MPAQNSLSSADQTFSGPYYRCTWGDPLVLPVPLAHAPRGDWHGLQACAGPCSYLGMRLRGRFVGAVTPQSAPAFSKSGALGIGPDAAPRSGRFVRCFNAGFRGGLDYFHHGLLLRAGYDLRVRNASAEMGLPARYNYAFQAALRY